jgi:hypothetical protein
MPTASAAKLIVPHGPPIGAVTSTKQRDKECDVMKPTRRTIYRQFIESLHLYMLFRTC